MLYSIVKKWKIEGDDEWDALRRLADNDHLGNEICTVRDGLDCSLQTHLIRLLHLLDRGKKVEAIKKHRMYAGCSLVEAAQFIRELDNP